MLKHFFSLAVFLLLVFFVKTGFAQTISSKKHRPNLFAEKDTLSYNDYLLSIERISELLDASYTEAEFGAGTFLLFGEMEETQKSLHLIVGNLRETSNNVRNQQMYRKVLQELQTQIEGQNKTLNSITGNLEKVMDKVTAIGKDAVFIKLIQDSLIRGQFANELNGLKLKYKSTDSLFKNNMRTLNLKKRETVRRKMTVSKAQIQVKDKLGKSGITLFGDEYPSIWDTGTGLQKSLSASNIRGKFELEQAAFSYYFSYTSGNLFFLLLVLALFYVWIRRNMRHLDKREKLKSLEMFHFSYLDKGILLPLFAFGLNLLIVSNLYAPAIYIDFLHLVLLIVIFFLFKKEGKSLLARNWAILSLLFLLICFLDLFVKVSFWQRSLLLLINLFCLFYGRLQLKKSLKEEVGLPVLFRLANWIFIVFNFLALVFNLFGRVSLANTLSLTAMITLTQIIILSVFLKITIEIILLQIYSIRIKRGIENIFDFESLSRNLRKPFLLLIISMWVIVIAANLNTWEALRGALSDLLGKAITIGNITFSMGSVLLFFIIVWIAHLLQKYVAYFFGEVDDQDAENVNKRQHSKLLVTRLIVLVSGYLLAIAASGMPLDKLSIVIGALGVGVGLGLQNIVNNFVSGVILIFDREIHVGDVIEVSSQSGRVKSMGLRTTKIDAANGAEIIIPNGNILSQNITNWTYSNNFKMVELRFKLNGLILAESISEVIKQSLGEVPMVYSEKESQIFYHAVAEDNYEIGLKFWCNIYRTEEGISNVRLALYRNFKLSNVVLT